MFGAAFLYYAVRFIIFVAIAGAGLYAGMKIREKKNA